MSDPACWLVRVSGRVQGVGFRMWAYNEARRLRINGWVRNMPDGRVEACLAASPDILAQMLQRMHQGPAMARVDAVEHADIEPPDGLVGFRVLE